MTDEECKVQTQKHIDNVQKMIAIITDKLICRGRDHDASKLSDPELSVFVEFTPKLSELTYGSDEYNKCLEAMKPALSHHYAINRHHPEYHDSISKMNLIDIVEMFCDWKAATLRHDNGDLEKSIKINSKRFGITDQLAAIFQNTVDILSPPISYIAIPYDGYKVEIKEVNGAGAGHPTPSAAIEAMWQALNDNRERLQAALIDTSCKLTALECAHKNHQLK